MNINDAYPSNYLKASDLDGKKVPVIISAVDMEKFDEGEKPVAMFEKKAKGMVLNKTNSMTIAAAYGPETDNWIGKEVILYSQMVNFQGQMTPALRIEIPQEVAGADEDIPF